MRYVEYYYPNNRTNMQQYCTVLCTVAKPVCRTGRRADAKLSHAASFIDELIDYNSWIVNLSLNVLMCSITFYYTDTSVLLENSPLVKFIRNHVPDSSGLVSISSLVRISMISLISSLIVS